MAGDAGFPRRGAARLGVGADHRPDVARRIAARETGIARDTRCGRREVMPQVLCEAGDAGVVQGEAGVVFDDAQALRRAIQRGVEETEGGAVGSQGGLPKVPKIVCGRRITTAVRLGQWHIAFAAGAKRAATSWKAISLVCPILAIFCHIGSAPPKPPAYRGGGDAAMRAAIGLSSESHKAYERSGLTCRDDSLGVLQVATGLGFADGMPTKRERRRRRAHWVAYLWPGLPHLWIRGSLAGLSLALAFSVLLNVLILGTLVWPEWLESRLKLVCGFSAACLWLAALWETRCELRRIAEQRESEAAAEVDKAANEPKENPSDALLRRAQANYLRQEWVEAERALKEMLRIDGRDVEARLWYATLMRRTGRDRQAKRRLRRLELLDDAAPWRFEIETELGRLTPRAAENTEATSDTTETTEPDTPTAEPMRRAA